jgi:Cd2+/Zn2+-exporting ATPase
MNKKQKTVLWRILITAALFALLEALQRWGPLNALPTWALLGCYLVPYGVIAYDVVGKALRNLRTGAIFDENLLMTIATVAAFAIGAYDEALAVMLFYQIGELFQKIAVGRSRGAIKALLEIVPQSANLETEDGVTEVDPDDVSVGQIIRIRPGERVPLDGDVIEGSSSLNTAALTGESLPRPVEAGEAVYAGCINGDGTLRVWVTKAFEDSMVTKILELVENASSKKAKAEAFITRFAKIYTPVVTAAALLLFLISVLCGGDWSEWLRRACIFLVISCPCALVISVPLGFFGGIGACSRAGVLVKGSNDLEAAAKLSSLVFDKTGTLTEGTFSVTAVRALNGTEDDILRFAAAAEAGSTHPIAQSIVAAYEKTPDADLLRELHEIPGHGVTAAYDGKTLLVGNERLLTQYGVAAPPHDAAATAVYVALDGDCLGIISIADRVKDGAKEALSSLRNAGVRRLTMLTGDRKAVGEAVAQSLSLDAVYTELLPDQKVTQLETLLAEKQPNTTLGYVGDGINDAPVLARADVGIAMGSMGSDAAIEAADVVILDDDLHKLGATIRIARKTTRIVKENIVFALAVKALVMGLGAFGVANMWLAVFADVGVSVLAILNSMRMLKKQ